ncbi:MAG: hypothetical protein H6574_02500 [Lewinellaceae bacterium]|nr:hypothetical protein [Saprospiraceae bacterium]MCB9329929.1 hypothetical protein [Lewinellaceae bacterium]
MNTIPTVLLLVFPFFIQAQESISRDTVPFAFWGSTLWQYSHAVDQIRSPDGQTLLAVRKYYPNGAVAEEYLRQSDTLWLFQQYDSLEHSHMLVRGLYEADPEFQVLDTLVTFDPENYERTILLRYSRYAFKTGPWLEQDRNGYVWTGMYEDGLREGLWEKRDAFDYTELRGYEYYGGEITGDTTLNWALSADTARIIGLLCEGVVPAQYGGIVQENTPGGLWRLCFVGPDMLGTHKLWRFNHLDYLPDQCTNDSWGSYLFQEDRTLLFMVSNQTFNYVFRDQGRWELLDGNKILLSLPKKGDTRFQMKYLANGELILVELPR